MSFRQVSGAYEGQEGVLFILLHTKPEHKTLFKQEMDGKVLLSSQTAQQEQRLVLLEVRWAETGGGVFLVVAP